MQVYPNYYNLFLTFFSHSIRMSENSIKFEDENIKKATSTKTKKYLI